MLKDEKIWQHKESEEENLQIHVRVRVLSYCFHSANVQCQVNLKI